MEKSEGKIMPTISTSCLSTKKLTLQTLDDDVIWLILAYLPLSDVLMFDEAVPAWNHITRKVLFKQQDAWSNYEYCVDGPQDINKWPKDENLFEYEFRLRHYYSRCVTTDRLLTDRGNIPKEWLKNESLAEYNILLQRCPNISVLYLYGLRFIGVAKLIAILECILRQCQNLKYLSIHYYPVFEYVERVVKIDMSKEQYMFDWIPFWGIENEKEIILTPELLEQHSQMTNGVLDYVQGILAKVGLKFRGPYWCYMMFKRRILKETNCPTRIEVAQLQCITLGICQNKYNRKEIMKQLDKCICCYSGESDSDNDELAKNVFPKDIETICSLLRQLDKLENFAQDLYRLQVANDPKWTHVIEESPYFCCPCCWRMSYRENKYALQQWDKHWNSVTKPNRERDWSTYECWSDLH